MNVLIPENINEITLSQYMDFDKSNKEDSDNEFLIHRIINIFCGIRMKDCLNIPLDEAEDIADTIAGVLQQESKLKTRFTHNNVEYGLIPNLSKITLGEYVDLEEYLKDTQTLHKAMAVLYRPVTKSFKDLYDIKPYTSANEHCEEFKSMPCGIATAATVFFWSLSKELLTDSLNYLPKELENKTTVQNHNSQQNMDGSLAFSHWLKAILPDLTK